MTLPERERLLLAAIQLQGELTAVELAKITGLKVHTVHYLLRQFEERGLIRRHVLLNMFALGFQEVEIYFSLSSISAEDRARLVNRLKSHPQVVWLASLGGKYQYGMTLCVRSVSEAAEFLNAIAKNYGEVLTRKSISSLLEFRLLPKKYLTSKSKKVAGAPVSISEGVPEAELDETDWKIIAILNQPGNESSYGISRSTGLPRATVEYRLKKLRAQRVIERTVYVINSIQLGRQVYRILVFARGVSHELTQGISKLAMENPNVVNFTRTFGEWDFELGVDVASPEEASGLVELILERFGPSIQSTEILPVFSQTNSSRLLSGYTQPPLLFRQSEPRKSLK